MISHIHLDHRHLDHLEEEAIFILREVAAAFERPGLLFSSGKDSCVVLRLAEKAFKQRVSGNEFKGKLPFPLVHVDTGHNFPEVIEFRERRVFRLLHTPSLRKRGPNRKAAMCSDST